MRYNKNSILNQTGGQRFKSWYKMGEASGTCNFI